MQLFYQRSRREDTKTPSQKNDANFNTSVSVQNKLVCHELMLS